MSDEEKPDEIRADEPTQALSDEERAALYKQHLKELRVINLAREMMLELVTVGYQKLGLTDETRDLRDLDDARLAIDLLGGVIAAVEGCVGAEETETYRGTLDAMRLSFARVAVAGEEAAGEAPAED